MGLTGTVDTKDEKVDNADNGKTTLPLILASPLCWKSDWLCVFYEKSQEKTNTTGTGNPQVCKFLNDFNSNTDCAVLCNNNESANWQLVVGETYFNILKGKFLKGTRQSKDFPFSPSLKDLHAVIRHKSIHALDLDDDSKKALPWYRKDDNGNMAFAKKLYINAWTTWFPLFQNYVWWKYQEFKTDGSLSPFYPQWLPNFVDETVYDYKLANVSFQLKQALKHQIDEGRLVARYEWPNTTRLEFRILEDVIVTELLRNCTAMEIEIANNEFTATWFMNDIQEEQRVTRLQYMSSHYNAYFLICDHLSENILSRILKKKLPKRLVIFTYAKLELNLNLRTEFRRSIAEFVHNFSTNSKPTCKPVTWHEISQGVRKRVEEEGTVLLQGKAVQLRTVLPEVVLVENFQFLLGDFLNEILRNLSQIGGSHATMFGLCSMPKIRHTTLPRRLKHAARVSVDLFFDRFEDDVFYIENSGDIDDYDSMLPVSDQVVLVDTEEVRTKVEPTIRLVASTEARFAAKKVPRSYSDLSMQSGSQMIYCVMKTNFRNKRHQKDGNSQIARHAHFFKYAGKNMFMLNLTTMPYNQYEKELLQLDKDQYVAIAVIDESDLKAISSNERMICISGKSGTGKSILLSRLATQYIKSDWQDCKRFVIYANLQQFVKALSKATLMPSELIVEQIRSVLLLIFAQNPFERQVLEYWLAGRDICGFVNIDLMFDGLDELSFELREWAFKAWEVIREEIPVIRIWITSKDHLIDTIALRFQCYAYTLDSLTKSEKLDLFVNHWKSYIDQNGNGIVKDLVQEQTLLMFANMCLQSGESSGLADTPLGCQLIAEVNEIKLDTLSTPVDLHRTAVPFYSMVVQRRFDSFLNNSLVADIIRDELIEKLEIGYMYHALRSVFSKYFREDLMACSFTMKNSKTRVDEMLMRIGILERKETFFHKTFADFFVARFFCKVINEEFAQIRITDTFIQTFIYNEMIAISQEVKRFPDLRHPTICNYLNEMLTEYVSHKTVLKSLLEKTLTKLEEHLSPHLDVTESAFNVFMAAENYPNLQVFIASLPKYILPLCLEAIIFGEFDLFEHIMNEEFCTLWNSLAQTIPLLFGTVDSPASGLRQLLLEHVFNPDGIQVCLKKNLSIIEKVDEQGRTPLLCLAQLSHYSGNGAPCEFAKVILNMFENILDGENCFHVNINATDNDGNSVLHVNLSRKYEPVFQVNPIHFYINLFNYVYGLKYFNKDLVNLKNKHGHTPLMTVIQYYRYVERVECAVVIYKNRGFDFTTTDNNGDTLLHYVIGQDFDKHLVGALVKWGAKASTVNQKGQTALHLAVEKGGIETVKVLVKADPNCIFYKDGEGKLASDYDTSDEINKVLAETWLEYFSDFTRMLNDDLGLS